MRMRWPLPEKPRKYRLPLPRWPASGQPLFWQQKCSIGCWLAVCIAPTPCPRWPCRVTPPFSFYPPLSALLRHHLIGLGVDNSVASLSGGSDIPPTFVADRRSAERAAWQPAMSYRRLASTGGPEPRNPGPALLSPAGSCRIAPPYCFPAPLTGAELPGDRKRQHRHT